jgi:putative hemolysin
MEGNELKKVLALVLVLVMAFSVVACSKPAEQAAAPAAGTTTAQPEGAKYHIGIVTGTYSQAEDEARGAEALIKKYGDVKDGGMIKHVTYPDNFASELETTISVIAGLADDPQMKAIIVNQGVGGTAPAFQQIRAKRPDILLLVGMPQEDPNVISQAADLVCDADNISRGFYMVKNAKDMGAKTFVHISFPRHMSIELLARRRAIMEEACKDLGLKFAFETAPDPATDIGLAGAQAQLLQMMPGLIAKYGKDTAFFTTNDGLSEPLIKQVIDNGAIYGENDTPTPLIGFPAALSLDLKDVAGDFPAITKRIEESVVAKGDGGRVAVAPFSFSYCNSAALGEFAKSVIDGKAKIDDTKALIEAFNTLTPGGNWITTKYKDVQTGEVKNNYLLVLEDTYVFGKGYTGSTNTPVPEKYLDIK